MNNIFYLNEIQVIEFSYYILQKQKYLIDKKI